METQQANNKPVNKQIVIVCAIIMFVAICGFFAGFYTHELRQSEYADVNQYYKEYLAHVTGCQDVIGAGQIQPVVPQFILNTTITSN